MQSTNRLFSGVAQMELTWEQDGFIHTMRGKVKDITTMIEESEPHYMYSTDVDPVEYRCTLAFEPVGDAYATVRRDKALKQVVIHKVFVPALSPKTIAQAAREADVDATTPFTVDTVGDQTVIVFEVEQ